MRFAFLVMVALAGSAQADSRQHSEQPLVTNRHAAAQEDVSPNESMQGYSWFAKNVVTRIIGAKVSSPVNVGVDVQPRGRIGVHVGVDLVRFSL